jgi:hypothetical protein
MKPTEKDLIPSEEQPMESLPKQSQELPHGLLKPPQAVLNALAMEKAKFPPGVFAREVEERTLNEWTVDYLFGHQLGYYDDVLYRPTPEGPEVIAVGTVEILDRTKNMRAEEQDLLKTWTPS